MNKISKFILKIFGKTLLQKIENKDVIIRKVIEDPGFYALDTDLKNELIYNIEFEKQK